MDRSLPYFLLAAAVMLATSFIGCDRRDDRPAGEQVQDAADRAGQAVESGARKAGDAASEGLQKGGKAAGEAIENAKPTIREAGENTGDFLQRWGEKVKEGARELTDPPPPSTAPAQP